MGVLPQLPRELITKILALSLEAEPICALKLFVPEWHLCGAQDRLESILKTTRFDTYTVRGPGKGDISTTFSHKPEDCIYLPVMEYPRVPDMMIDEHIYRELVKEWSGRAMMVFGQEFRDIGSLMEPRIAEMLRETVMLREPSAVATLPFSDLAGSGLRQWGVPATPGKTVKEEWEEGTATYLFQRVRHVMLNTDPFLWPLKATDFRHADDELSEIPLETLMAVQARLEEEQFIHLFVDWAAMPRLESVFLDVRQFSKDGLDDLEDRTMRAAASCLAGRELDLLVVAGLRSYASYPGPQEMLEEDVKVRKHGEFSLGGADWICLFRDAVKVGGRLILVDKQVDTIHRLPFCRSDMLTYAHSS